jgi:predicted ferric reductase
MEKLETTLVWITLGMAAVLVGLYTAKYRKSRSTHNLIMVIGHVLLAETIVALLAIR